MLTVSKRSISSLELETASVVKIALRFCIVLGLVPVEDSWGAEAWVLADLPAALRFGMDAFWWGETWALASVLVALGFFIIVGLVSVDVFCGAETWAPAGVPAELKRA